jgi:hypothetical protein
MARSSKEHRMAYQRIWRKKNPDKVKAYDKKHYQSHKQHEVEMSKKWNKVHQDYLKEYRQSTKEKWIEYLTANNRTQCVRCGYNTSFWALDFHHINPEEKEYGISRVLTHKISDKFKVEIDKTITLCSNCHRELHAGVWSL